MSEAAQLLRRAKSEFERRGIRNEVQITEHVAYLLLPQVRERWDEIRAQPGAHIEPLLRELHDRLQHGYPDLRVPQPPPVRQWGPESLDDLLTYLQNAFDVSPHNASWGTFFQRDIRFELLKGSSGSQYPTPHHIAELMAVLALSGSQATSVLDPTAGSSGLLVSCASHVVVSELAACDFDPQWAGIGSANLILHEVENANYRVGSALEYTERYANRFGAVVMNPPFGGSRSAGEVANTIGSHFGRSNATVLTAMALHTLRQGGYMVGLVPSGVLFGGGGEATLRAKIFLEHQLEAVITLPENAFQPYSQVAAHLLVVQKSDPSDAGWFCAIAQDGYPAGAGRDLTSELNPSQNELPRTRDLILQTRQDAWTTQLTIDRVGEIQTTRLGDAGALPGVAVRMVSDEANMRWRVVHLANGAVVRLADGTGGQLGWLHATYTTAETIQAMSVAEAQTISWETCLPADLWAEDLSGDWQGTSDDVSLTIDQGDASELGLQRGRTRFVFKSDGQHPGMACLLNEAGEPLTPWLHISEERSQSDISDSQFGDDFQATAIEDARGGLVGWLLDLQAATSENEQVQEGNEGAFLLIVTADQATLYPGDMDGSGAIALLKNGWLHFASKDTPRLTVETGVPVKLREDIQISGFAIGPSPASSSEGFGYNLFGVLVPHTEVIAESGAVEDLRPARFLPEPDTAPPAHPMQVFARMRKNQTKLSARLDNLLQAIGQPERDDETAETAGSVPDWLTEMLSAKQQKFLNLLRQQQVNGRPRHFNIPDVVGWCQESDTDYGEEEIYQQLQLLVRMGLVKEVYTQGHNVYRPVTGGDLMEAAGETTQ